MNTKGIITVWVFILILLSPILLNRIFGDSANALSMIILIIMVGWLIYETILTIYDDE